MLCSDVLTENFLC